ncbi:amidohydrolase [Candidatus Protofrankia californiensis]|uniref:amidohydrolase n=1 Tax=Candidatus Protofrankia californiensis TaxID=1839754 RepID=UPI00104138BE|nr:amidohydrolase [Candidatus Protofrankia californiensis]
MKVENFVAAWLEDNEKDLVDVRRDIHAHPELSWQELRTTELIAESLNGSGLKPRVMSSGTGLWCDVGTGSGPVVMVRADIDALPIRDEKDLPYSSCVSGVSHACGHDVHTAIVLGVGMALAAFDERHSLPGTVRLVFQPAEEVMPGGALDLIREGVLDSVTAATAVHCDPALEVGRVGIRSGPITAATDYIEVRLQGPGGHTSRPQNTVDLVYALAQVVTGLPAALSRTVDPRAAACLVWGQIEAGSVPNAIPRSGLLRGTLRLLDEELWKQAPAMVERLVSQIVAPFGATATIEHRQDVPPVLNSVSTTEALRRATVTAIGEDAVAPTGQSLGGEDFAWYLQRVPGALARLGTRSPGGPVYDLHQGRFDVDERAIGLGVRLLATTAVDLVSAAGEAEAGE